MGIAGNETVQVRTYTARTQAEASQRFQTDANELGAQGYRPTSQTWVGPSKGRILATPLILILTGYFVGALTIGAVYGLGIAAVASVVYLLYAPRRAVGTLSVTYTR